jgi:hypothetical protein
MKLAAGHSMQMILTAYWALILAISAWHIKGIYPEGAKSNCEKQIE